MTTPIDNKTPGEQTGQVTVTFPDGSKKMVDVPVNVKEAEADGGSQTETPDKVDGGSQTEMMHKGVLSTTIATAKDASKKEQSNQIKLSNNQEKILPKTGGSNQDTVIAVAGAIVSGIAGIGLAKLRKSEEENRM